MSWGTCHGGRAYRQTRLSALTLHAILLDVETEFGVFKGLTAAALALLTDICNCTRTSLFLFISHCYVQFWGYISVPSSQRPAVAVFTLDGASVGRSSGHSHHAVMSDVSSCVGHRLTGRQLCRRMLRRPQTASSSRKRRSHTCLRPCPKAWDGLCTASQPK